VLKADIPASYIATAGSASVTVFNPGAGESNAQTFTINKPVLTVTSITSDSACFGNKSISVTISGTNFVIGAAVKLTKRGQTDRIATGVNVSSPTTITCNFNLTNAALGSWKVVVTNLDHGTGTLRGRFRVN
jgi:hypothetical protein